jgi:hypothetical protein
VLDCDRSGATMIDLIWGRALVFESRLSADEITKRLQREVAPATWQRYETRRQLFLGTFADGRFRMMRLVRGKNSFRPLIEGHLSPASTGVRIDVRLKLHPVVLIFCSALFLVGVFTASIALPEAFASGASVQAFVIVLAVALAVLGTLAIVRFEANEATRLLAGLFEAQAGSSRGS